MCLRCSLYKVSFIYTLVIIFLCYRSLFWSSAVSQIKLWDSTINIKNLKSVCSTHKSVFKKSDLQNCKNQILHQVDEISEESRQTDLKTSFVPLGHGLRPKFFLTKSGVKLTTRLQLNHLWLRQWAQSRNNPGFDPSILRHSRSWGAADEAMSNKSKISPCWITE